MKKYIHVTSEDRQFLAKAFNVSNVTVWKALRFEQDTDTIRRIQKAARERGGTLLAVDRRVALEVEMVVTEAACRVTWVASLAAAVIWKTA